eukprot:m.76651 g.76651  ORF g.76651 m.76651 type:complete len:64 (+) comp10544_c0_seq2:2-193(+)
MDPGMRKSAMTSDEDRPATSSLPETLVDPKGSNIWLSGNIVMLSVHQGEDTRPLVVTLPAKVL